MEALQTIGWDFWPGFMYSSWTTLQPIGMLCYFCITKIIDDDQGNDFTMGVNRKLMLVFPNYSHCILKPWSIWKAFPEVSECCAPGFRNYVVHASNQWMKTCSHRNRVLLVDDPTLNSENHEGKVDHPYCQEPTDVFRGLHDVFVSCNEQQHTISWIGLLDNLYCKVWSPLIRMNFSISTWRNHTVFTIKYRHN